MFDRLATAAFAVAGAAALATVTAFTTATATTVTVLAGTTVATFAAGTTVAATIAALREKYDLHMAVDRYTPTDQPETDSQYIRK